MGCVGELNAINKCSNLNASGGKYNLLCFMSHKYTFHIPNVLIVDYRADIHCKFESKVVP